MPTRLAVLLQRRKSPPPAWRQRSSPAQKQPPAPVRSGACRRPRHGNDWPRSVVPSSCSCRISRRFGGTVNEDGAEVVDIGESRPGAMRSPSRVKKPVESLSARNLAASRPSSRARVAVVPSTKAPAGSLALPAPPSVPSVSPASAAMPLAPARPIASASAYSWFGPPRPDPRIVTVSSPPDRITARRPAAWSSRASVACAAATSRASPSTWSPRKTHS